MRALPSRLKPASGFSHYFHIGLTLLLPVLVYVLVSATFVLPALAVILLSKWRMFVVRPRFWLANIRANAIDIMVGLSFLTFMANSNNSTAWRLVWMVAYMVWLLFIKPGSSTFMVSIQAFVGQTLALTALFIAWPDAPLYGYVFAVWLIAYLAARHFFTSFEEPYGPLYASTWAYFAGALVWVLTHALIFYPKANPIIAQPTLFLTGIGGSLASLYYLEYFDRLSKLVRREVLFVCFAIVSALLISLIVETGRLGI